MYRTLRGMLLRENNRRQSAVMWPNAKLFIFLLTYSIVLFIISSSSNVVVVVYELKSEHVKPLNQ